MESREAMITPIVLVSDDYCIVKQNTDQDSDPNKQITIDNMRRFFVMTKDLPQELQILIVSIMFGVNKYGLNGDLVTQYSKKIFYEFNK
ncbi:MAG: hypothetical protein Terrestrivirus3_142 [Terrestrivirus sp.]|uniref:Uncharacterized protein n=1 Tax=Terrestrivirus sp. TaxID=2487775 RepID=A0A3G4ZQI6_9VIRU|nr:MAG: hypothetical protein Terrestrivirus3_142 [Terrestrivirus sp.]